MGPAARSPVADAASGSEHLILLSLRGRLAALDEFRNWLIREAA